MGHVRLWMDHMGLWMSHMRLYMSPCSEPSLLRFFTSHEQLAAGGAGQHHGERLASRDARQRTSTSTNGGRHSLMLTQLDINCIFCWPMCDYGLSSRTAFVSCVRQFFISSFYNSTSRLNAFKKLASYYSSKQPLERIYKLASSSEADLRAVRKNKLKNCV